MYFQMFEKPLILPKCHEIRPHNQFLAHMQVGRLHAIINDEHVSNVNEQVSAYGYHYSERSNGQARNTDASNHHDTINKWSTGVR